LCQSGCDEAELRGEVLVDKQDVHGPALRWRSPRLKFVLHHP
jgi:hypothetical protein